MPSAVTLPVAGALSAPGMWPAAGSTGSTSPRYRSAALASKRKPDLATRAAASSSSTGMPPPWPAVKSPGAGSRHPGSHRLAGGRPGGQAAVKDRNLVMAEVSQQPPQPGRDRRRPRRRRRRPAGRRAVPPSASRLRTRRPLATDGGRPRPIPPALPGTCPGQRRPRPAGGPPGTPRCPAGRRAASERRAELAVDPIPAASVSSATLINGRALDSITVDNLPHPVHNQARRGAVPAPACGQTSCMPAQPGASGLVRCQAPAWSSVRSDCQQRHQLVGLRERTVHPHQRATRAARPASPRSRSGRTARRSRRRSAPRRRRSPVRTSHRRWPAPCLPPRRGPRAPPAQVLSTSPAAPGRQYKCLARGSPPSSARPSRSSGSSIDVHPVGGRDISHPVIGGDVQHRAVRHRRRELLGKLVDMGELVLPGV